MCYKCKKALYAFCIVFVCRAMCGKMRLMTNKRYEQSQYKIRMAPVQYYVGCSGLFVSSCCFSGVCVCIFFNKKCIELWIMVIFEAFNNALCSTYKEIKSNNCRVIKCAGEKKTCNSFFFLSYIK